MHSFDTSVLWEPATVDLAAIVTGTSLVAIVTLFVVAPLVSAAWNGVGGVIAAMTKKSHSNIPAIALRRRVQKGLVGAAAGVIATLGLYVGYATFRANNMLGALQYISEQGNNVARMETDVPGALCVYRWGEASPNAPREVSRARARDGCGPEIFVNAETGRLASSFDDIQLYIEETILFASESNIYRDRYGADFYRGLAYWVADFSEDETGAISYYIVSREIDDAEEDGRGEVDARSLDCLEEFTGIRAEDICGRYRAFISEMGGAIGDRLDQVQCDVPVDYSTSLEGAPDYECDGSYWGQYFRGEPQE